MLGILLIGLGRAAAQPAIPPAAAAAEAASDWHAAVRAYRAVLTERPQRADLWQRLADVEARLGNLPGVVDALTQAAHAAPTNPDVYYRLSQAYSMRNAAAAALQAIEGALRLDADVPEYLLARAQLAAWMSDYGRAQSTYRRLLALQPTNDEVRLALARVSAWGGKTNEATRAYQQYVSRHPEQADVWIEWTRAEMWRGNYAAALKVLNGYRARFGDSTTYQQERAAVLARADRPTAARTILRPLIEARPDALPLHVSNTIALLAQQRAHEARHSLETLRNLRPEDPEAIGVGEMLRASIAPNAGPRAGFYTDSDRLQVFRSAFQVSAPLWFDMRLDAGFERQDLEARRGTGLERADGGTRTEQEHGWLGLQQRLGRLTLAGRAGRARTSGAELFSYRIGAELRPHDAWKVRIDRSFEPFSISPRAVSLGLSRRTDRLRVSWSPGVRYQIDAEGAVHELSDGNQRWEVLVTPRRQVLRSQRLNLDIGAALHQFGNKLDLSNGYYDPRRYENYSLVLFPYWKTSENTGIGFVIGAGAQRDETFPEYRFGWNAAAEATIGIYKSWMFQVHASATVNERTETGAFRGFGSGVSLSRRF